MGPAGVVHDSFSVLSLENHSNPTWVTVINWINLHKLTHSIVHTLGSCCRPMPWLSVCLSIESRADCPSMPGCFHAPLFTRLPSRPCYSPLWLSLLRENLLCERSASYWVPSPLNNDAGSGYCLLQLSAGTLVLPMSLWSFGTVASSS